MERGEVVHVANLSKFREPVLEIGITLDPIKGEAIRAAIDAVTDAALIKLRVKSQSRADKAKFATYTPPIKADTNMRELDDVEIINLIRQSNVEQLAGSEALTLYMIAAIQNNKAFDPDNFTPTDCSLLHQIEILWNLAVNIFEDTDIAADWFSRKNKGLGDVAPYTFFDTIPGIELVANSLGAIKYGHVA